MSTEPKRIGGKGRIAEITAHRKAMGLPVGRQRGVPNKLTTQTRKALLQVFDNLGGVEGMTLWARKHPTQFYGFLIKAMPKEREANAAGSGINIVIGTAEGMRPAIDVSRTDYADLDDDPESA